MSLDSDDDSDSGSEGEYDESSDDSDAEIDDEETNFVGLSYSLPQQGTNVKYKITSEGIRTNSECITWETYDYLTYCFDIVRKKKKRKQGRRNVTRPKSPCSALVSSPIFTSSRTSASCPTRRSRPSTPDRPIAPNASRARSGGCR